VVLRERQAGRAPRDRHARRLQQLVTRSFALNWRRRCCFFHQRRPPSDLRRSCRGQLPQRFEQNRDNEIRLMAGTVCD
jgi:hypothetical protein